MLENHCLLAVHDYLVNIFTATLCICRLSPPAAMWWRTMPWWQWPTCITPHTCSIHPLHWIQASLPWRKISGETYFYSIISHNKFMDGDSPRVFRLSTVFPFPLLAQVWPSHPCRRSVTSNKEQPVGVMQNTTNHRSWDDRAGILKLWLWGFWWCCWLSRTTADIKYWVSKWLKAQEKKCIFNSKRTWIFQGSFM